MSTIFGGVKVTYPRLGLVLFTVGLGRSKACGHFGLLVGSVPPLSKPIVIVPTFRGVLLWRQVDCPRTRSWRGLEKEVNKSCAAGQPQIIAFT